ncbi:tRNA pseudouridine(38-40) synthase TruA [Candidatus Thorarchaeota archaeon]|nr:MAG: tRNA pseudouridine(38-40) synthase TruA [Candidatus Thorarchaeota archaeon]
MPKYACKLFYLGTGYHGSQYQPNLPTIQGELINGLTKWSGYEYPSTSVAFSGRTDKGVNSIGQTVCFETEGKIQINQINEHLPEDIILWAETEVPMDFNPRHRVLFRHYRYYFDTSQSDVDFSRIMNAASKLEGLHDFQFLSKPDGDKSTNTVLLNVCIANERITFADFYGINFLWKLVRKSVNLLVSIGKGEIHPNVCRQLLDGADVLPSGIEPAPPENLFLIDAAIPLRMKKNKNALNTIRKRLKKRIAYFHRYRRALEGVVADCFNETFLC